jgi:hypothetical protein
VNNPEGTGARYLAVRASCIAFLLAFAIFLYGCLLPLPGETVHEVSEKSIAAILPGSSTRTDVLLLFGDPTRRGSKDEYFVYEWERFHGGLVLGFPLPFGMAYADSCHQLVIGFGPTGLVSRLRVFRGEAQSSVDLLAPQGVGICTRDTELIHQVEAWLAEMPTVGQ